MFRRSPAQHTLLRKFEKFPQMGLLHVGNSLFIAVVNHQISELGPYWDHLGASPAILGPPRNRPGAYWGHPEPSWRRDTAILAPRYNAKEKVLIFSRVFYSFRVHRWPFAGHFGITCSHVGTILGPSGGHVCAKLGLPSAIWRILGPSASKKPIRV